MNLKKISSVALATIVVSTGLSGLTAFADSSNNIANTKSSYMEEKDFYKNYEKDFTEKVIIDNQEYTFNHKFSGDLHTIEIKGGNESNIVTFNSKSNEVYLNGEYMNTAQKETELVPDSGAIQTKSTWTKMGTHKFKYNFVGTESKAVIAGIIAGMCSLPASIIVGGVGGILGVAGFCSFKETVYYKTNNKNFRKYDLAIYSDRSWSSYETTVTHYGVI